MTTPPHSLIASWHEGTEEVCQELRCRRSHIVEKGMCLQRLNRLLMFLKHVHFQEAPQEGVRQREDCPEIKARVTHNDSFVSLSRDGKHGESRDIQYLQWNIINLIR